MGKKSTIFSREEKQKKTIKSTDALKRIDKQFHIIFENSLAVMLFIDPESHKIVAANHAAENFYGWKQSEIEKMSIDDINTLTPAEIESEMKRALRGKRIYYKFKHRLANGQMRHVEVYSSKVEIDGKDYLHSIIHDVTQLVQAEQALRQSQSYNRTLFEQSAIGLALTSIEGKLVDINPAFASIIGRTVEEARQFTSRDITPEKYACRDQEQLDLLEKTGRFGPYEKEYIHKDGHRVPVRIQGLIFEKNRERYIWSSVEDISEQQKAVEALTHSHELMRYIIEHNQSAVAVHDRDLKYLFVSQRYLDDYRVKEKDVIGKHHYEVFPDIPEKWKEVHQKALRGVVSRADEDLFYREDGTADWTRWECRPWHESDGSIGGIIIYTEVINDHKQKEEEIRKLNQRLEILIDSIQQLSSTQSIDAVQEIVAKSARNLIGADGATIVLREKDHCFYVNEDAIQPLWKGKKFPMNSCISGWVMQNRKPVVIEDIYSDDRISKEIYKSTFVKSLAMVPINISKSIGAIGNYWKESYTPKETEMQMLQTLANAAARAIENIQLYTELEERVKSRTMQLQAVNKELETFTYSVSHDLKAPLRGIDGYSRLLLEDYGDSLNEEAAHFIKTIRSSTLQMNRLIEDLLSYSRLERSHFKQEKIALKLFVEKLISNFSEEIKRDRFEIELNVPETEIMADSTGLSIALRNYIENAIKFTRDNPNPKLEINYSEKPESWTLAVKDNGVGFDMKYHNRIFEIFQRLHRTEDYAGTGIGLAMVAKASQRMNGKIRAESVPGKGSTFFIEIPKIKSL